MRVTQYYDSACEEVPLEHIPTELVPHYSLTLADFVGSFNGPKSQETTFVPGFTDLIYVEFVTDEKDIKTVLDEKSKEIHDMLYGAEFYAKKYQPGKELVSDILGCVSLGAWSIYKAYTGYDPITQEYLSPEERKELMQTGTMNAVFFAFGVANMPVMGIKEIAVSYLSIAGGGTSAELTESACEALGLSQEDTRLLSALVGLAVGYTIYSAGSSYLDFYRQNKAAIKAEMAESAPYKAASPLDEMVDDVDDLAVKPKCINPDKGGSNTEVIMPSKPHTNGTQGHWETILDEVDVMKNSGDYSKIYVNKGLSNEIPGAKPNRRPDIMGVRNNGLIDQVEVPSKTDIPDLLIDRMIDNQRIMGVRAGNIKIRNSGGD